MRRSATYALFAAVTVLGAAPALAQSIPEGQSCGGLLCDVGVFGHKTAPAAPPPTGAPTPEPQAGRRAEAVAPADLREPAEPRKRTVVRKKRIAKAVAAPAPAAPAPAVAAPRLSPVAAAPAGAASPVVPATQVRAVPAPPPASAANVTVNPFVQTGPSIMQFQPLY